MHSNPRLLITLRHASRLIWVVLVAVVLQPLVLAEQPAAQWVSLPYCSTPAPDHFAPAHSAAPASRGRAQPRSHSLLVLLNPAAAFTASSTLAALPAHCTPALPCVAGVVAIRRAQWTAPHSAAPPRSPQQPRAPPRFS